MIDDLTPSTIYRIAFVWLGGLILNAAIAHAKGHDVMTTIIASVLLSPVITYLYIAAVPGEEKRAKEPT